MSGSDALQVQVVTTQADLDECLLVRRAVFINEQGLSEDEEIDEHDGDPAEVTSTVHVLGRLGGWPVATGRLLLPAPSGGPAGEHAHIGRVAVLRDLRGQGHGRAIMAALHAEARRLPFPGITLASQLQAIPFYERLGYCVRGEVFLDAGIEHRWMDLTWTPSSR